MALEKVSTIMQRAYEDKKAVMCFECVNYEQIAWSIRAAEEENCPVLLMLYFDMDYYTPAPMFIQMAKPLVDAAKIPVGMTYVYGETEEMVKQAIAAGFLSVCYNPKSEALEERIAETKRIVEIAHEKGVDVVANPGEYDAITAEEAVRFAKQTGIDGMVAPGVYGSKDNNLNFTELRHWFETNVDYIDFEKLEAIQKGTGLPLVIHRSYNISWEELQRSTEYGVAKIDNGAPFDTQFFRAAQTVLQEIDCGDSYFAMLEFMQAKLMPYLRMCVRKAAKKEN